jgi:hypothetical protein
MVRNMLVKLRLGEVCSLPGRFLQTRPSQLPGCDGRFLLRHARTRTLGSMATLSQKIGLTMRLGAGAYSQQIGFRSRDVIAAFVLAVTVIREMSTPQAAPEIRCALPP